MSAHGYALHSVWPQLSFFPPQLSFRPNGLERIRGAHTVSADADDLPIRGRNGVFVCSTSATESQACLVSSCSISARGYALHGVCPQLSFPFSLVTFCCSIDFVSRFLEFMSHTMILI